MESKHSLKFQLGTLCYSSYLILGKVTGAKLFLTPEN